MDYIYQHDDCLDHDPGSSHPENAGRLKSSSTALKAASFRRQIQYHSAPLGTDEQILLAHSPTCLQLVKTTAPAQGRRSLDADTVMSPGSFAAALRGVGAACAGVDALMSKQCTHAFVMTRPPGHHATTQQPMGFCIFNHIAIAALYAMEHYHLERVAIMDFDVHHGNGTQDILHARKGMLYLSTHQSPLYPGTGSRAENRPGNICNIPLPAGTGDAAYQAVFTEEILPVLHAFKPQLLLVSAGFDAHLRDPLANIALTENSYPWLGQQLRSVAKLHAENRLLSVLEGGYNLEVLGDSVLAWLEGAHCNAYGEANT